MDDNKPQAISEARVKGFSDEEIMRVRKRFILNNGVFCFGLSLFYMNISRHIDEGRSFRETLPLILIDLLLWPLAGYCFGVLMWAVAKWDFLDREFERRHAEPRRVPVKFRECFLWLALVGLGLAIMIHRSLASPDWAREYLWPLAAVALFLFFQAMALTQHRELLYRQATTLPRSALPLRQALGAYWPLFLLLIALLGFHGAKQLVMICLTLGLSQFPLSIWIYYRSRREFGNARHRENPAAVPDA